VTKVIVPVHTAVAYAWERKVIGNASFSSVSRRLWLHDLGSIPILSLRCCILR